MISQKGLSLFVWVIKFLAKRSSSNKKMTISNAAKSNRLMHTNKLWILVLVLSSMGVVQAQKGYNELKKQEISLLFGNWTSTNYKGKTVSFVNDMQRNPKGFCSVVFSHYPKNDPQKKLTLNIESLSQNKIRSIMISDGHGGNHHYEPIKILVRDDRKKIIVQYTNTNIKEYYVKG